MRLHSMLLILSAAAAILPATAQTFDTSGDGQLNGIYNFREVAYQVTDSFGNPDNVALYGTISFDGKGNYNLNGTLLDANSGISAVNNFTGTYQISASGMGFLDSALAQSVSVYGLTSNGIFIGSSTEAGINDVFIAAPAGSPANATFSGSYSLASVDFPSLDPTQAFDAFLQMGADGKGNLGAVNVTAYGGGSGTPITQNIAGASYSFAAGSGTLHFGGDPSTMLIAGDRIVYISPDGNFVFGGSNNDFDLFVGVRTTGKTPAFSGLYYQAGLDEDESNVSATRLDTYYGSFYVADKVILAHQRLAIQQAGNAFDYTFDDPFTLNADGTYDDSFLAQHYVVGAGGAVRIGYGVATASGGLVLGISVALEAPTFSGKGVFLNPTGIVNAASSAPFTAGISPGEMITLYGTGLATKPATAAVQPFPTLLGGVKVMINNRPAPIYYVSPTQISALVPYATEISVADIQVINNNVTSNTAVVFVGNTTAGVYTNPFGGIGDAAALHQPPDYSVVTASHPARPGETIQVFLTGLGAVKPPVADGAAAPGTPNLSKATNQIAAYVQGNTATVSYAGLAPTLSGLYQLNVQLPSTGLTAGDAYINVAGPDSYTSEAKISIGSGTASSTAAEAGAHSRPFRVLPRPSRPPSGRRPWIDLRRPATARAQ